MCVLLRWPQPKGRKVRILRTRTVDHPVLTQDAVGIGYFASLKCQNEPVSFIAPVLLL